MPGVKVYLLRPTPVHSVRVRSSKLLIYDINQAAWRRFFAYDGGVLFRETMKPSECSEALADQFRLKQLDRIRLLHATSAKAVAR